MTIRIPDAKHQRLRLLAERRGVSPNKLVEEWVNVAIDQHDAEVRFQAMAARGDALRGLMLIAKLDRVFANRP